MNKLVPPYPLISDALRQGLVIPFLGSGASLSENKSNTPQDKRKRTNLPSAAALTRYLAQKTQFPPNEPRDLAKVAQYYNVVAGRKRLREELHRIFNRDCSVTSLHTFLAEVPKKLLIVTTNYDDLIENAFRSQGRAYDVVVHASESTLGEQVLWWPYEKSKPINSKPNKLYIDFQKVTVIYKMHGAVDRYLPERDQYVITEDDYIDFLARMIKKTAIPAIFAEPFQTRHFLFLGYSLRDWNLRVVLNHIEKTLRRSKEIKSWAIQNNPSSLERRFWQDRGVEVYDMKIEEFVKKLKEA